MRTLLARRAAAARDAVLHRVLRVPGEAQPYVRDDDLAAPMRDGVSLLADRYVPQGSTGPQPVVLVRCPYGRRGLLGQVFAIPLALRGFQVLVQSTRGTFGSGGEFRPFCHEQEDGLDTLEWVRAQPWCDGRVATVGASYFGHTQWAVAPYADPPLAASCLDITASRVTAAFYTDGVPNLQNALGWTQSIGTQERGVLPPLVPNLRHALLMRRALRTRPLQAADVTVAGSPVQFWRDFCEHAGPGDGHWVQADHQDADLAAVPPTSMVSGWWDLFAAEQLRDFTRLQRAGKDVRITVGPWMHGEPPQIAEIVASSVRWLDRHLDGVDDDPGRAPVRLYLQGADRWLDLATWPPTESAATAFHLQPGGGLDTAPPTAEQAASTFVYDPADPTPGVGGPLLFRPAKQVDNAAVEARADVVTFTGPVLTAPLDLVGELSAVVHVRTQLPHTDVFVRICDVDAQGRSLNVADGIRGLTPDTADAAPDADGVREVAVSLFPTAYRVPAGHRLRVQVSGGAFPRYRANPGTGEPFAGAVSGTPNRIEVLHDARRPSRVVLPVLGP